MCSSNLSTVSNNTDRYYWIVQIRDMIWACALHIWHAILFLMLHIIWCGSFSKYYYCIYNHGKALLSNWSICHSSLGVTLKYNDLLTSVAKLINFLKSRALLEKRQLLGKQLPVLGRFLSWLFENTFIKHSRQRANCCYDQIWTVCHSDNTF